MKRLAAWTLATGALLLVGGVAWADTCETFPGSQVFTDQGCDKPYDNGAREKAPPASPAHSDPGLRERLRKGLSEGAAGRAGSATGSTAEQLNQRVTDARARVDAALADPTAPGARERYDAAIKDLHAAYSDAAQTFPDRADLFRSLESEDAANASARAEAAGLDAPAVASPAPAAGPDNVTAVGGTVYVCDGAIAGANNVSCREISADGKQCTGVTLADGGVGWRDSVATPCGGDDMAQRETFLSGNKDAAAAVRDAGPGFTMDAAGTEAEIARLTAAPPPPRPLDADEKKDWDAAMADDDTPPSIEDAHAATPIDPSSAQASGNGDSGSNLDDAIDMLNAASSILGGAAALAGAHSVPSAALRSAPAIHVPPPPQFHSPPPTPVTHCSNGASQCETTAQ